jgi:hypothetical protein
MFWNDERFPNNVIISTAHTIQYLNRKDDGMHTRIQKVTLHTYRYC